MPGCRRRAGRRRLTATWPWSRTYRVRSSSPSTPSIAAPAWAAGAIAAGAAWVRRPRPCATTPLERWWWTCSTLAPYRLLGASVEHVHHQRSNGVVAHGRGRRTHAAPAAIAPAAHAGAAIEGVDGLLLRPRYVRDQGHVAVRRLRPALRLQPGIDALHDPLRHERRGAFGLFRPVVGLVRAELRRRIVVRGHRRCRSAAGQQQEYECHGNGSHWSAPRIG